jgi:hypothetical protein
MDDATASAIPSDLTHWAYWASGLNTRLDGIGKQLSQAIDDFNSAIQEPRFTSNVDQVGNDLIGYAGRNSVIDDWVGKVGLAFLQADHKGLSGQAYRTKYEDPEHMLSRASEADLAVLVGDDPTKQADRAANATELAAQLKEAEDTNDAGRIQAILRQLQDQSGILLQLPGQEQSQSTAVQEFAYRFFNELGPDQTIKTLIAIDRMKDDGSLHMFDTELGQATQHPNWDPNFTSALLNLRGQTWDDGYLPYGEIPLSMLKYGTFSEDFLTQSADCFAVYMTPPTST